MYLFLAAIACYQRLYNLDATFVDGIEKLRTYSCQGCIHEVQYCFHRKFIFFLFRAQQITPDAILHELAPTRENRLLNNFESKESTKILFSFRDERKEDIRDRASLTWMPRWTSALLAQAISIHMRNIPSFCFVSSRFFLSFLISCWQWSLFLTFHVTDSLPEALFFCADILCRHWMRIQTQTQTEHVHGVADIKYNIQIHTQQHIRIEIISRAFVCVCENILHNEVIIFQSEMENKRAHGKQNEKKIGWDSL